MWKTNVNQIAVYIYITCVSFLSIIFTESLKSGSIPLMLRLTHFILWSVVCIQERPTSCKLWWQFHDSIFYSWHFCIGSTSRCFFTIRPTENVCVANKQSGHIFFSLTNFCGRKESKTTLHILLFGWWKEVVRAYPF